MVGGLEVGVPTSLTTPRLGSLLLLVSALTAWPAAAEPTTYQVDPAESEVVVFLYKAGLAARMAHDHVIAATDFAGEITHDPEAPEATSASITVQAGSLAVDLPRLVKKHGIKSSPSADDRKTIKKTLESKEQLHVKEHPTITFRSTGAKRVKDALYLTGTFTLRGVSKTVTFLIDLELEDGALRGRGRFPVRQSDFGYKPYSAFLGAVKVKDRALIQVDLVARPAKARDEVGETPKGEGEDE
jgi:polyisoprenoid-binding protein YceI